MSNSENFNEESFYNPFNDNSPVASKDYKSFVVDEKSLKFSCYADYLVIKKLYNNLLSGTMYDNRQLENELEELDDIAREWGDSYYDDLYYYSY